MKITAKKKIVTIVLCMAMLVCLTGVCPASAKKAICLNKKKVTLYVGKKVTLKVKNTKKKVTWSSSRKKVAKVSKKGVVTAVKKGTAKITAKVNKKRLTCKILVKKKKAIAKTPAPTMTKKPVATPLPTKMPETTPTSTSTPTPTAKPTPIPGTDSTIPVFSAEAGSYDEAFTLQMYVKDGYKIYYTTDGSIPDETDTPYTAGIEMKNRDSESNVLCSAENIKKMYIAGSGYDFVPEVSDVAKCNVIRAIAVSPAGEKSAVVTKSYFVGKNLKEKYNNVAVFSLVTDSDNLLNEDTGISVLGKIYDEWKTTADGKTIIQGKKYWNYVGNYTQKGKEWEREASLELFDGENKQTLSVPVGIRLHGGASRMYGQKSFNIYFRKDYGLKTLSYGLFPDAKNPAGETIDTYKSFMLRNGGNDTELTKFHDAFIQSLLSDRDYMTQSARPAVLYLNGEYWGVYNLAEKYSDKDIAEHFGVDADNVVAIKEGEVEEGEDADIALYEDLQSYAQKDLSDSATYEEFCSKVDIQSMLDYYATEIYIGNSDWPVKNFELWRTRTVEEGNDYGDKKWRWMVYDTEYSMGLYNDSRTKYSFDNFASTVEEDALFASAVKNASFREAFLSTIKEIGSTNFNYTTASAKLKELKAIYQPFMADYYNRFMSWNPMQQYFEGNVSTMDTYLKNRYRYIIADVESDMAKY